MSCGCSSDTTIVVPSATQVTLSLSSDTYAVNTTISAGARAIFIYNQGGGNAQVNGASLPAGAAINFPFIAPHVKYPAIAIVANGATLRVDRISF